MDWAALLNPPVQACTPVFDEVPVEKILPACGPFYLLPPPLLVPRRALARSRPGGSRSAQAMPARSRVYYASGPV